MAWYKMIRKAIDAVTHRVRPTERNVAGEHFGDNWGDNYRLSESYTQHIDDYVDSLIRTESPDSTNVVLNMSEYEAYKQNALQEVSRAMDQRLLARDEQAGMVVLGCDSQQFGDYKNYLQGKIFKEVGGAQHIDSAHLKQYTEFVRPRRRREVRARVDNVTRFDVSNPKRKWVQRLSGVMSSSLSG